MRLGRVQIEEEQVWWPGYGNRLLFILRPSREVCDAIAGSMRRARLGSLLVPGWPPDCWHQSVSDRYADKPWIRERLIAAGDQVRASGFDLELDQARARAHAEIRARGRCVGLERLIDTIGEATLAQGLPRGGNHSPHITLDYGYEGPDISSHPLLTVSWRIEAFELVAGGGRPYRYNTLARWQLDPAPARVVQTDLFS